MYLCYWRINSPEVHTDSDGTVSACLGLLGRASVTEASIVVPASNLCCTGTRGGSDGGGGECMTVICNLL